jgi:hypothetical protein
LGRARPLRRPGFQERDDDTTTARRFRTFDLSKASHRSDLLNERQTPTNFTNDGLIAYLSELVGTFGHHFEVTAVNSDHPTTDGGPNGRGHNAGCAIDGWPLISATPGSFIDAGTEAFRTFLEHARACNPLQIGLVGDGADSAANFAAAGPTAFQDDGGAHVHLGARKQ